MNLEQLKQAVEEFKRISDSLIRDNILLCGNVHKERLDKLIDTCQLVLNSPSLVGDKPRLGNGFTMCDIVLSAENKSWNACNQANRIARVRWLKWRLDFPKELKYFIWERCEMDDKKTEEILNKVRQHFEKGEVKTQEGKS